MSRIMDPNIIIASKMTPLDLVIAVHRDSQAVLSYIMGLEEENNRLRTNPAGTLRQQLQSITQDGFNSMILEIDKVISTTNSTFACMQDQIRHVLQTRSVGSYITPRPNVLIHYPEPKKNEEKGNLMARRGKDMLSISDLQHAFSKHDPLGRDSKVVQEGSAFQSFLDSARSIGIKCSPSQETTLKSTSAPQQTTPTKTSGKCCDDKISDVDKTDSTTNGKCYHNNISNIEKTDPTKAVAEVFIVPSFKYNMNQLLHLRKTAYTNPFEHNTDEEIKLILPKGLEHRRRPPYVAGLPKRWSLNVGSAVSNIQMAKANVDSVVSDSEIKPLAEVELNVVSAFSNNRNSGPSPLMTFSDTEVKPIKPEKNVETTKWDIQPSKVPLSKVAHKDEAASFLAWMMSRDAMKLTGK